MKRHEVTPRADWVQKVESAGMIYHHTDGKIYWKESAYYELTEAEVDVLEIATTELWLRCLDAVEYVLSKGSLAKLGIPAAAERLIRQSWDEDWPSIYGRFDLAYTAGPPKLLEFNADTPTMLLEAGVVQWQWLQELHPTADQFNSIHEKLVAKWKSLKDGEDVDEIVHFAHLDNVEDLMTVSYLRDTAEQAGLRTTPMLMNQIGWDGSIFHDPELTRIKTLFKLYPWEWVWREPFAEYLPANSKWIEPPWRLILSSKGILAILWELFPGHPNLLPAHIKGQADLKEWVQKPLFGREGHNISFSPACNIQEQTGGEYGAEGYVYQAYVDLPVFLDKWRAVIGSWVIDQQPAGIGIRETDGYIVQNPSPFVPHLFRGGTK